MKAKIMIVDDEPANLFLLKNLLSEFETCTACNYNDLMEKLNEFTPSLMLMDIMMPGKDGFSIAEELSENEKYRDVPIIFLSARDSSDDVVAGFEKGGSDYIKKPFSEKELIARIKNAAKKTEQFVVLKEESLIDPLTLLYNRRYLEKYIIIENNKFKRRNTVFSVSLIDIDLFKEINDGYGHAAGDHVLKYFSGIIRNSLRSYDIAFRYGGEEFLVVFPDILRADAASLIGRISDGCSKPVSFEGKCIDFTFTCGISDTSDACKSDNVFEDMIKTADARLYEGKKCGRNKIVYNKN